MEYNTILKKVEEQKSEKNIAGKMFRYSGLILAVDFFSQKLNSEQIMDAAFDFVNELLSLENSAIYCARNDNYELIRFKGLDRNVKMINDNNHFKNLAVLHGNILCGKEAILRYFNEDLVNSYNLSIVIPIIVDSILDGFILIPEKSGDQFDNDDFIICEVLMKLFNSAMENCKRFSELQNINLSLDEKIFNLFAINQSSKALLSELNLDILYNLSIDVFSELTQSSSTGFVLFDKRSENFSLKSYKFIFREIINLNIELELKKNAVIDPNKIIIDILNEQDTDYFNNLFEDGINAIKELMPQYIVLLNNSKANSILGFVTLGATVTGVNYKKSIFELIESLTSSTYISISNAKLFKQVLEQKRIIQNKLDRLISLNNLMKNINSSNNLETLLEITDKTLDISFGAEKCFIALYDKKTKDFMIESSHGLNTNSKVIKTNHYWNRVLSGRTALAFEIDELKKFFGDRVLDHFGDITTALILPIYLDKIDIELLGVLIIFKFRNSMISDEENVLTMETIAGHIAPILHNLTIIEEQKRFLLPDYIKIFKSDLKKDIDYAIKFSLNLCILRISNLNEFDFKSKSIANKLSQHFQKVYPFSQNTIYMITNEEDNEIVERIQKITGERNLAVKEYLFKRDFNNYTEFLNL